MKKNLYVGLFGLSCLFANAQNNQQNSLATSGGLEAGTTSSGTGQNAFYGYRSGKVNTTGVYNTFMGNNSGVVNTTGSSNTFIGNFSGQKNTIGAGNTFIGDKSGQSNTGGASNTCVGTFAGVSITNGQANTIMGTNGGAGCSGSGNTMIGMEAGWSSFGNPGNNNTFLGASAGTESVGSENVFIGYQAGSGQTIDGAFIVENYNYFQPAPLIKGDFATGKVGIAVSSFPSTAGSVDVSGYKFFVKGGILAEEIRVATTWADYVFEKDYQLPTLKEVEQHITEKGHLINVPSAKQVEENGISLGEIAKIQQEKIEELTLYIIEQNKVNEKQAEEIKEMKEFMMNLAAKK
ncbi:hypothetical protein [Flavobacterium cerinum]|uniref:TMF family protein n=1 Tax=Flavobacterium cerinum TaxID=2502784 RepID=A0A3S3Q824_9FLAO|nr:hypothetical protein [Flavobacterium cerinum]RWW98819.1 hypothetical protein EPI11_12900 [Flavobacterium cerinum]